MGIIGYEAYCMSSKGSIDRGVGVNYNPAVGGQPARLFPIEEGDAVSAKAFVLIETAVGKTKEVVSILKKIEGLKTVDTVTGPYDIIAVIEAEDLNQVGDVITGNVHNIEGISRTVTCLAV